MVFSKDFLKKILLTLNKVTQINLLYDFFIKNIKNEKSILINIVLTTIIMQSITIIVHLNCFFL